MREGRILTDKNQEAAVGVSVSSFPKRLYSFLPVKTTTKSKSDVFSNENAVV